MTICTNFDKETREVIKAELPKICKGIAIITGNACGKILAAPFLLAAKQKKFPYKLFTEEKEALEWLEKLRETVA